MLKLNPNPTFTVPVEIVVPGQEACEILRVTFRHKTVEQLQAWTEKRSENPIRDGLADIIVEWNNLLDDEGNQVPYSTEQLDRLLSNYGHIGPVLVEAYVSSLAGARRKN